MTNRMSVTWYGERWYGDPKWSAARGPGYPNINDLKIKRLGFTLEGSVSRPGFARNAKLYVRLATSEDKVARKVVLTKEFATSKEAKKTLNRLWYEMQNNSEPEDTALGNFLSALDALPDVSPPPIPPGTSHPGYGYPGASRPYYSRSHPGYSYPGSSTHRESSLEELSTEWW